MTIEEEFFKTFGIEPKMLCNCEFKNLYDYRIAYGSDVCIYAEVEDERENCSTCKLAKQTYPLYPEITDRILLELICIMNQFRRTELTYDDYEGLKKQILMDCYGYYNLLKNNVQSIAEEYKQQVRSLFDEVEE